MSQDKQAPPLPADVDRILSTMVDAVTSLEPDDPEIRRKLAAVFGEAADRLRGVDVSMIYKSTATGRLALVGSEHKADAYEGRREVRLRVRQNESQSTEQGIPAKHAALALALLRKAVDQ